MAKDSIRDFSATAGSNTDIQSVNIDENCPASGINNAIREIMVDLKNVSTGAVALETPAADQLNVDNIRIDGNTISSTDTNGDITIDPNGTGDVVVAAGHKLGIGTSSPDTSLHISAASSARLRLEDTTNNVKADILVGDTSSVIGNASNHDLAFMTNDVNRMTIDSSGNVGIGTNSVASGGSNTTNFNVHTPAATSVYLKLSNSSTGNSASDGLDLSQDSSGNAYFINRENGFSSFWTNATERMRIDSGGKVYIGRTGDPYMSTGSVKRLSVDGGTTSTDATFVSNKNSASTMFHFYFHNSNSVVGSISTNAHATSFNTSSDHRLKENVADISGAIARVKSLQPKRFNWITEPDTTIDGFLAHEAAAVVPESVTGSHNETRAATGIVKAAGGKVLAESVEQADWTANKGDDEGDLYPSDSTWTASEDLPVYQTIDQAKLVPLLTAALKETIAKIETLETEMTALKARVTALEA
jgi:hypothetical protein